MATVEELRGIVNRPLHEVSQAMAMAMSMFNRQQADADKEVGREMSNLSKKYISVLQSITGVKDGWVASPTSYLLSIDNEDAGITIDIHWETDLGSNKANITVELNKRSGPEGPGAKWKSKFHIVKGVKPDQTNLSPTKIITDQAVRKFLKEHAEELLAVLVEEGGWVEIVEEADKMNDVEELRSIIEGKPRGIGRRSGGASDADTVPKTKQPFNLGYFDVFEDVEPDGKGLEEVNKYDIRRSEEAWKDAKAIADSYKEDGDPREKKARADAEKLKKDHDALVKKWEGQKKKSREHSRARAGAMRSVGMVRTRSGQWEDTDQEPLDEVRMNPFAVRQKVKLAMNAFIKKLPKTLQTASKGGIPWKPIQRDELYNNDNGLLDGVYFQYDRRVSMQKGVVTGPGGNPYVTVTQESPDVDEFSIRVGIDFEESGTTDFIDKEVTSDEVVKILNTNGPAMFQRWLRRTNFTYDMPEETSMSTAQELRSLIEYKGTPYGKSHGSREADLWGSEHGEKKHVGSKRRSGHSKQAKKMARKGERQAAKKEIQARLRGEALGEAKTVYILKNHNGTVLATHTDVKKLANEMLKYEAQTGIQTRIEVKSEDVSLDDLGAYLELVAEELEEAMASGQTTEPVQPVVPMQMAHLKIIQQTADQLSRFTKEFAVYLKGAMRVKQVDVARLGQFGRQVDAAHRIFHDTYRRLALGYREADELDDEFDAIAEAMAIGATGAFEVPSPVPFAKKATLGSRRRWRKIWRENGIPMGAQEMMIELATIAPSLSVQDRKLVDKMMNMTWYGPENVGSRPDAKGLIDAIKKLHKRIFGKVRNNPTR